MDRATSDIGVAVRVDTGSTNTAYFYIAAGTGDRELRKVVAGTSTLLASAATGFSASDVIRLEASGTTITPIVNGSTDAVIGGSVPDSAITSGAAGKLFERVYAPLTEGLISPIAGDRKLQ